MKHILRILALSFVVFLGLQGETLAGCATEGGAETCVAHEVKGPPEFGACREGGDFQTIDANFCIALGGTWTQNVQTGPYCAGAAPLTEGDFPAAARYAEQHFHGACSVSGGNPAWQSPITSGVCGDHEDVIIDGITKVKFGRATIQYLLADSLGACASGPNQVSYLTSMYTPVGCPAGYLVGYSAITGKEVCYMPPPCDTCKGNPTDVGNGAKRQSDTDYQSPAPGGLSFIRYYNSAGFFSDTGRASTSNDYWRHNYAIRLVLYPGNAFVRGAIQAADGFVTYFKNNGQQVGNGAGGGAARLDAVSGPGTAAWRHTTGEADVLDFDASGKLLTVTKRAGFVQTLSYDGSGRLETITDSYGRTITLTYASGSQLIATMTDPAGRVYSYGYDTVGRLSTVTYPGPKVRTYVYEDANFLWGLSGIIDERGSRLSTYTYDAQGRVASSQRAGQADRYSFTYSLNPTTSTTYVVDPFGNSNTYEFKRVNDILKPANIALIGRGNEAIAYDANGNPVQKTSRAGSVTTYVYDAVRNLETSRTEGYGTSVARTITTTWHPTYRQPATITEPSGVPSVNLVTEFTYDTAGNLTQKKITAGASSREWNYTYNSVGQVLTIDGPRTDVTDLTTFTYYSASHACVGCRGQVATITNALGHVTSYDSYNADGAPTQITEPNGLVITFTYTPRGLVESRAAGSEVVQFAYDGGGSLIRITMPDSSWLGYVYDDANGLVEVNDRAGNKIEYELDVYGNRVDELVSDERGVLRKELYRFYDVANRLRAEMGSKGQWSEFTYDGNNNIASSTDANYNLTTNFYDAHGRVYQTRDAQSRLTLFTYDAKDHLTTVQDTRSLTTTYTYNGLGDLTQLASPDTGTTSYTRDSAGNVASQTDARSVATTYTYDALNRVTAATVTDGTVGYEYDNLSTGGAYARGRLTKITDPSGNMTWAYDVQGRVTSKVQSVMASPANRTFTVGYGYSGGRPGSMTYPSGRVVSYGYDLQGRAIDLTVDGTTILSGAQYLPFGGATRWSWGNGEVYERGIDLDGRVSSVTLGPSTGTYADMNQTFGYDVMNRLSSAGLAAGQSQGYAYDYNGNRTSATVNAASTTYTYPGTSHRLSTLSGATARSFSYDNAGNLTSSAGVAYVYDGRGRMKSAGATTYLVNGLGQRVRKNSGNDQFFVYDESGRLIGEYDSSGATIQEIVWFANQPVAVLRPNGAALDVFYVWADHVGSPRLISDVANRIRWDWAHNDPFGGSQANENPAGLGTFNFNLRFPGQYYDAETGNHYNYFRDFDPKLGRYLESDPMGLYAGGNTYLYVFGRPMHATDRYGLAMDCKYVFDGYYDKFINLKIQDEIYEWRKDCWAHPEPGIGGPDPLDGPPRRGVKPGPPIDINWQRKCDLDYDKVIIQPEIWKLVKSKWQRQHQECTDTCTGKTEYIQLPDTPANIMPK